MSLQTDLDEARAKVAEIEAKIAALPAELLEKTEAELTVFWHAITTYFSGSVPPAP
jgi:hypothetical protein